MRTAVTDTGLGQVLRAEDDRRQPQLLAFAVELWDEVVQLGRAENATLFSKPVHVALSDAEAADACACALPELDLVVVTRGLVVALEAAVLRLIDAPDSPLGVHLAQAGKTASDPELQRGLRVVGLLEAALRFVLLHELAHLFYGHPAFLEQRLGDGAADWLRMTRHAAALDEALAPGARAGRERRALEVQADRYAADVSLMLALKEAWQAIGPGSALDASLQEGLERGAIAQWSAGMSIVFGLIESLHGDPPSHPHPRLRHVLAMQSALVVYTSNHRVGQQGEGPRLLVDPSDFLALGNEAQEEVERTWSRVGPPLPRRQPPTEEDYRALLDDIVRLFPRMPTRFEAGHVV